MKILRILLLLFVTVPLHAITLDEAKAAYNIARMTNSDLYQIIQTKLAFEQAGITNTTQLYEVLRLTHQAIIDKKLMAEERSTLNLFSDMLNAMATRMPTKERNDLIYDVYGFTHKAFIENIVKKWFYIYDALVDPNQQEKIRTEYNQAKSLLGID